MTRPTPARRPAPTTLALVLRRAVADRLVTGPAWLLALGAVTLLVASVLGADVARRDGLGRALAAIPAADLAVVVRASLASATAGPDLADVRDRIEEALDGTDARVTVTLRSDSYGLRDAADPSRLVRFADVDGVADGVAMVEGRLPDPGADPVEVVLAEAGAAAVGLGPGDTVDLERRRDGEPLAVRVVGMVRVVDPADPRWAAEPLVVSGAETGESFTVAGPLLAARQDLLDRMATRSVAAAWVGVVDPAAIDEAELRPLAARVGELDRVLDARLGGSGADVETGLRASLDGVAGSLLAGGTGTILLSAQLAILAAYGLVLIAGLLLDERRAETALVRSRGGDELHLARWSATEGALIVGTAGLGGLALAYLLVAVTGSGALAGAGGAASPRLDGRVVAVAAGTAAAGLLAFLLPTLASVGPLASARRALGRQGPRSTAQRAGLDLALLALAALGLWQLREYGAPVTRDARGTLGVDPLLVAAPAVALLAGAVLALRIMPLAATLAERAVRGSRGLLLPLGARQLARRPGRYSRTALLLVMATAVTLFGGAYAATWERSQADQADQAAGADLQAAIGDERAEAWAVDAAIGGIGGIGGRTPVRDEGLELGAAGRGTLLAVRPEAGSVLRIRADRAAVPLPELFASMAAARPAATGVPLPAGTRAIRVSMATALEPWLSDEQPIPFRAVYPGLVAVAVVRDSSGLVARFSAPSADFEAMARDVVVPLAGDAGTEPAGPLELLAVELVVELPDGSAAVGSLALEGVAAGSDPGAPADRDDAWTPVTGFPGFAGTTGTGSGWGFTRQLRDGDPVRVPPAATSGTGTSVRVGIPTTEPVVGPVPVAFAVRAPGLDGTDPLAVPALVEPSVAAVFGAGTGDEVTVREAFSSPRRLVITGTLTGLPTVPAGRPFTLVDLPTLALSDYLAHGRTIRADAWWLALASPGDEPAVVAALEALPSRVTVTSRAALLEERLTDPVTGTLLGTLATGAIAAALFAAIGFLVTAVVGTRERLPELAVLRALGVTRRRLSAWLAAEQALLLGVGILLGSILGAVLAWVVLPSATLGPEPGAVDPAPLVTLPPGPMLLLGVAAGALLAATAIAQARLVARGDVPAVLRAGDG